MTCRRLLLSWCFALGACGGPVATPAQRFSAILGGVRDTGDPAVVLLLSYPPDLSTFYTCTASVIAPALLLTAAHCVDAPNHPGYLYGAFLGDDASSYATAAAIAPQLHAAKEAHAHPQYDPNSPFYADIGVVVLKDPLTVAPLPIQRAALPVNLPGQAARIVGYGQTQVGQYNAKKYAAATTVQALPPDDTVVVGDAQRRSCVGDSGGPALVQLGGVEKVIGVDSYAGVGCTNPAHYRRVDQFVAFLDLYLPPPPPPDLALPAPSDAGAQPTDASELTPDAAAVSTPPTRAGGCAMTATSPPAGFSLALVLLLFLLLHTARKRSANEDGQAGLAQPVRSRRAPYGTTPDIVRGSPPQ